MAARARLRLRVGADASARLEAEGRGVDAALGRLLVIVYRAMENDSWRRLKACRSDTCQWAFYDHSKNRSGHWCSMEVCGAATRRSSTASAARAAELSSAYSGRAAEAASKSFSGMWQ